MKITHDLRKAINSGVRRLCGAVPLAEVGLRQTRDGTVGANGLNWEVDADLEHHVRFSELQEVDDCTELPGCATLDLYITSGTGASRQLETNVYVTIKDGQLADLHRDDLAADSRCGAILGRDFSAQSAEVTSMDEMKLMNQNQASAIMSALFTWLYDEPLTSPERQRMQLSLIANIVIDACHRDIRNQPLHDAYAVHKRARGLV